MAVEYFRLGADRRLSEVIFAGSHDASITSGGANAQTQNLDIAGQAAAGVRLFDLRILARSVGPNRRQAQLVGYHGKGKNKTASRAMLATNQTATLKVADKMKYGTFGLSLSSMLIQARNFVSQSDEFLIFKFDKCTNYQLIAEQCIEFLGATIYTDGGELGKKTLGDLRGKVICIFPSSGIQEMTGMGPDDGILGWRNLNGKEGRIRKRSVVKPYDPNFQGLQYFGKGGTNPLSGGSKLKKMAENEKKQAKLAKRIGDKALDYGPYVLGMMYWTSTGLNASIQDRNRVMWSPTGVRRMEALWAEALENSIGTQLEQDSVLIRQFGGVLRMKTHFPNIIMIDFADPGKCDTIYDLNHAKDERLARAYEQFVA